MAFLYENMQSTNNAFFTKPFSDIQMQIKEFTGERKYTVIEIVVVDKFILTPWFISALNSFDCRKRN